MHLGNARTALLAWLACRHGGGTMIMRLEDLDSTRVVPGAADRLLADLRWLGLDWDEGPDVGGPHAPYLQTQRTADYDAAIDHLLRTGAAFLCACSRADVNRAASAPHGEPGAFDDTSAGPRYPGTCRDLPAGEVESRARAAGRAPTVRFRGQAQNLPTSFVDGLRGVVDPLPLPAGIDDFVIRRADGVAAYQLAVVVDDASMHITQVVRGDDLLSSTPRQLALYRALALTPPRFFHVPLVLSPEGDRLAKRSRPISIADLRARGVAADVIIGALAASANLIPPGRRVPARDLVANFDPARIAVAAVALDPAQWPAELAP
jgi:glutamyl-tRNA synthetase